MTVLALTQNPKALPGEAGWECRRGRRPGSSGQMPTAWQRLARALLQAIVHNPSLGAVLTRNMSEGEALTALRTGEIPNIGRDLKLRPTHFTRDEPANNADEAQQEYELQERPAYRATVPEERVPNPHVPEAGPTTSGGGSQLVTDEPVPVAPEEIVPLDPVVDPIVFPF